MIMVVMRNLDARFLHTRESRFFVEGKCLVLLLNGKEAKQMSRRYRIERRMRTGEKCVWVQFVMESGDKRYCKISFLENVHLGKNSPYSSSVQYLADRFENMSIILTNSFGTEYLRKSVLNGFRQ